MNQRRRLIALVAALAASVAVLPVGASPGGAAASWSTVYDDTFSTNTGRWDAYTGQPGSDPWTRWSADRVRIGGGVMTLDGVPRSDDPRYWFTGGVSNWQNAQTYGRWTIRFRSTPSSVLSYHLLLWPKSEQWPPEIDLAESFDPTRQSLDAFVHYRNPDGSRAKQHGWRAVNTTAWTTVRVEWTPTAVTYYLNGRLWWQVTGAAVPHEPMFLALQTETQLCDRSVADCTRDAVAGARLQIDRVTVEEYRP